MTNQTETLNASEQVNQALADILTKVTSGVDGVVEFSKEQIPDVVEQLLLWHTFESFLWFFVGVICLSVGLYRWGIQVKLRDKYDQLYQDSKMGSDMHDIHITSSYTLPYVLGVAGCLFLFNNLEFIKILVAPKLYLLEYATTLMKG